MANKIKKLLKSRKGKIICGCMLAVCLVAVLCLCFWKKSAQTPLAENAKQETNSSKAEEEKELTLYEQDVLFLQSKQIPVPEKTVDFEELQKNTNEDIYAWIYIPDTEVDYPILQHATDNNYYLKYNVDGTEGYPGCIYTENYNNKYFTDKNTVLYGHNMRDGSMFGNLKAYQDTQYYQEHPYVYIYTPGRLYAYEIFAAYQSDNLHLLLNYDLSKEEVFADYLVNALSTAKDKGIVTADWKPSGTEYILTLSTCVPGSSEHRFLVQGRLITPDL